MKAWFYNTTLYYKFRYYFIRKKAPLSWIFWHEILRRESSSEGMYGVSIATVEPDCGINFSQGAWGDNVISINVYDGENKLIEIVDIHLSYRTMKKIRTGFSKASRISRKKVAEEVQLEMQKSSERTASTKASPSTH